MPKIRELRTLDDALASGVEDFNNWKEELEEKKDNMEERFSATERYQILSDLLDELDRLDPGELEVPSHFSELMAEYYTVQKKYLKRSETRDNIVAAFAAVRDTLDAVDVHDRAKTLGMEDKAEEWEEEIERFSSDLGDIISDLEGLDV